jgi:hypothetical protein
MLKFLIYLPNKQIQDHEILEKKYGGERLQEVLPPQSSLWNY